MKPTQHCKASILQLKISSFFKKESVCQCKRGKFDPWSGKILHAIGQLSPFPQLLCLRARQPVGSNKGSPCHGKPTRGKGEWPLLAPSRETPLTATKTQHGQRQITFLRKVMSVSLREESHRRRNGHLPISNTWTELQEGQRWWGLTPEVCRSQCWSSWRGVLTLSLTGPNYPRVRPINVPVAQQTQQVARMLTR